jgi:hypothetical protein
MYGPFKAALKTAVDDWHTLHNVSLIFIHEIAELSRQPYIQKFNSANIISGFVKSGIHPFNRLVFDDNDFLPSAVTDRKGDRSKFNTGAKWDIAILIPQFLLSFNENSCRQRSFDDSHWP